MSFVKELEPTDKISPNPSDEGRVLPSMNHHGCGERTGDCAHTNLSRIRAIFSAAWPSPKDFDFVPSGLNFSIAWRISSVSVPTRAFQPSSKVSIHSVSSRKVTHGTPKK